MLYFDIFTGLLYSAFAFAGEKEIFISPAQGSAFYYDSSPTERSGCTVSASQPLRAAVLAETSNYFEIEFKQPLNGCWWQTWQGLDLKRGFIQKSEITWQENKDEAPVMVKTIPSEMEQMPAPSKIQPCLPSPEEETQKTNLGMLPTKEIPDEKYEAEDTVPAEVKSWDLADFIKFLRWQQSGLKSPKGIDQYLKCYPYGNEGFDNYKKYSKYIDLAAENFRIETQNIVYEVHPSLMRCLLRRESGYDPKEKSNTGAAGLGQHTDINIAEISRRINKEGSWEQKLWRNFFAKVRETPEGRKQLKKCMGSSVTDRPVFETKEDAKCPLQSIAASSIYNLLIQRELMKSSKSKNIDWEQELDYQLAVAAAYNLGNGASRAAVENLFVGDWLKAIKKMSKKSKDPNKDEEVDGHITAIRNCLQEDNWKPMEKKDKPVCSNFAEISAPKKEPKN